MKSACESEKVDLDLKKRGRQKKIGAWKTKSRDHDLEKSPWAQKSASDQKIVTNKNAIGIIKMSPVSWKVGILAKKNNTSIFWKFCWDQKNSPQS